MTAKLLSTRDPVPASPEPGPPAGTSLLFLREEQIRLTQDLLFLAYRDFTASADVELERIGLGRAHHRALHFIARRPGITVSELLGLLRITKQSLARVLGELVARGYVMQETGRRDRRQRLLSLTEAGRGLERLLFERQREVVAGAYREAGGAAIEGFRKVMRALMDGRSRALLDGLPASDRSR
ncbi:MarR family winged helix-turn-helix transcriptional regulator [Lichenicoccus sp.]|uniref:MarR family winged helix-turn-helix transcriptional regulator n=1 Tax=Lichenicoccus sp. TaxID=2781899 RepID=UPI003D11ED9C